MKRLFAIMAVLCLMLCACGTQEAAPTTTVPTTTAAPTTEPTTAPTTEPTTAPTTEPPVLYRHPLTGEPLDAPWTKRPVAVVTNNSNKAMPQMGTSQADVFIELLSEGGTTRNLAIYSDVAQVSKVGSIRSARTYLQSLSKSFGAVLVHSGDSIHANKEFKTGRFDHIDGMFYNIFYRDKARLNKGYSLEHTLVVKGEKLAALAAEKFTMETDRQDYGFIFDENMQMTGESAQKLKISFFVKSKTTTFTYDAEKGAYGTYQHGQNYVDGNTGERVYWDNVLVLYAQMRTSASSHVFYTLEGSNNGYYMCDGKFQPIVWNRATEFDSFTYSYGDGTPVTMKPGTTYIAIIHKDSLTEFE